MKSTRWFRSAVSRFASVVVLAVSTTAATPAEPVWQALECVPADLAPEALFEPVQVVDGFESASQNWSALSGGQNARAVVHRDTGEAHGGKASLRVDYDFLGKKDFEYILVNGKAEIAQPGMGFGFWIKHDGTPFVMRLRLIDAGGECHQIDLLGSTTAGWQYVAGSLDDHSSSWGGDGNKRKDYPCRLDGICLDRPQVGFVGKGSLWIDDVAVVRPAKASTRPLKVEVQEKRFGNLYAVGEAVALRASGEGDRVRWSVADFFGRHVARGEGAAVATEARFKLDQPGWFSCKLELLAADRVIGTHLFLCAALPEGAEKARSDFFGVCTHYGQNAYPLETMDLMRRYGIDQFRDEISWRSYEPQKGRLALPAYAATYLKRAAELKLRPLIIYDYSNPFYDGGGFPNSPEAIAAFSAYAVDLTRQTRGMVDMFEVWNEWVGGCGMDGKPGVHDGEAYGRLLKPVYTAVKKEFPQVTVVGIGGEYGAKCADHILGAIRTAGPHAMDAWSIHPYRYPRPPESSDLVGEVSGIAGKVASAGARTKAWITEIGYPTHRTSGGSDETAQARHCVRTLVLLQSMRQVGKVFWYDLKDDGLSRDYNENNFGLVRHQRYNCAPKPGIVAASVFIRMTGAAEFKELRRDGSVYAATYRQPDGTDVMVLWTERGAAKVKLGGDAQAGCDIMGGALTAGQWTEASQNPIYLTGRKLALEAAR